MKNYKAKLQLNSIIEEESKDISNTHPNGTNESFMEYSFDINSSQNNHNNSLNIQNPFKPFLEEI